MSEQIIVSISREFGSAGHEIAEKVAENLGITIYDRAILKDIAKQNGQLSEEEIEKYDEKPKNPLFVRKLGEYTNSMEEHVANMQFTYLKEKAEAGESFVVVGRCADAVLKDYRGLITIFITGDEKEKLLRVMTKYEMGKEEAIQKIARHDKKRKQYHNDYAESKWGEIHSYDLIINSTKLGVDETAELISQYVKTRA